MLEGKEQGLRSPADDEPSGEQADPGKPSQWVAKGRQGYQQCREGKAASKGKGKAVPKGGRRGPAEVKTTAKFNNATAGPARVLHGWVPAVRTL